MATSGLYQRRTAGYVTRTLRPRLNLRCAGPVASRMLGGDTKPLPHLEVTVTVLRSLARTRAFPILAWFYLVALAVQVFFAGMYVFVGASNIELHRNMAHVIGLTHLLLIVSVFAGRVPERRAVFMLLGLLVVQGMLVHMGQWFGLWLIAAFHPVNALLLTYVAFTLAQRSSRYWTAGVADAPRATVAGTTVPTAA